MLVLQRTTSLKDLADAVTWVMRCPSTRPVLMTVAHTLWQQPGKAERAHCLYADMSTSVTL